MHAHLFYLLVDGGVFFDVHVLRWQVGFGLVIIIKRMKYSTRLWGKSSFSSPYSWAAKVLLCAKINVGFWSLLMTFAMTKVLPLPVMPRSVCLSFVEKFSTNCSTAVSCPGEILYGEISSNCTLLPHKRQE